MNKEKNITTAMGNDHCPICSHSMALATSLDQPAVPNPGDISLCIKCGGILQYGPDMALIKMPENVWSKLPFPFKAKMLFVQTQIRKIQANAIRQN